MFNKLFHELEGPGYIVTPRYFDIYSDLKIIDSPLSPKGIDQWKKASELAHSVDFDYIFVSPLRRAIETAYYMFRSHPNFHRIKFILHPMVRENIMTAGDIPGDINKVVDQYGWEFPDFNTSFLPRGHEGKFDELYYTRDFSQDLLNKVNGLNKNDTDLVLCEEIREAFPKSIEKYEYTNGRVQQMKEFFKQFVLTGKDSYNYT